MKKFKLDHKAVTFGNMFEMSNEIEFTPSFDNDNNDSYDFNNRLSNQNDYEELYQNKYQSNRYTEGIYEFVSFHVILEPLNSHVIVSRFVRELKLESEIR